MVELDKDLFRKRLREIRKRKKLTQESAGKLLGVSRTCYSSWELGPSCPPIDDLFKICLVFSISADHLLGITDELNKQLKPFLSTDIHHSLNSRIIHHENGQAEYIEQLPHMSKSSNPLMALDPDLRYRAEGYIDGLLEQQKERSQQVKKGEKA